MSTTAANETDALERVLAGLELTAATSLRLRLDALDDADVVVSRLQLSEVSGHHATLLPPLFAITGFRQRGSAAAELALHLGTRPTAPAPATPSSAC